VERLGATRVASFGLYFAIDRYGRSKNRVFGILRQLTLVKAFGFRRFRLLCIARATVRQHAITHAEHGAGG